MLQSRNVSAGTRLDAVPVLESNVTSQVQSNRNEGSANFSLAEPPTLNDPEVSQWMQPQPGFLPVPHSGIEGMIQSSSGLILEEAYICYDDDIVFMNPLAWPCLS